MPKTRIMEIKGQKIRVTQHGQPDPRLVEKAYSSLISTILRQYENELNQLKTNVAANG